MSAPTPNPMPDNIDYSHTSNVARLHAAAAREKSEPAAKATPISLWIVAGVVALGMMAGSYRGANTGSDFASANIKGYSYPLQFEDMPPIGSTEPSELEQHQPEYWLAMGKSVYSNACVTCHTATGDGQPGLYPPLKLSEFVIKGERRLVAILQHGVAGSLTVNGKPFNGQMQPLGANMTPKQLGQVLSYIRNNDWGNKASIIYDDQIVALRKELGNRASYTEAELREIAEDANAPASKWPEELKKAGAPAAAGAAAPGTPAAAAAPGAPAATPPAAPPAK